MKAAPAFGPTTVTIAVPAGALSPHRTTTLRDTGLTSSVNTDGAATTRSVSKMVAGDPVAPLAVMVMVST